MMQKKNIKKQVRKNRKENKQGQEREQDGLFQISSLSSPLLSSSIEYLGHEKTLVISEERELIIFNPITKQVLHSIPMTSTVITFGISSDNSLYVLDSQGLVQMISMDNYTLIQSWHPLQPTHSIFKAIFINDYQELILKLHNDYNNIIRCPFQQGHKQETINTFEFYHNSRHSNDEGYDDYQVKNREDKGDKEKEKEKENKLKDYLMIVSGDSRYIIESLNQIMNIYDLCLNRVIRYIRHHLPITCLSVSPSLSCLSMGDTQGVIHQFHQPISTEQYSPLHQTSVHWHSQPVQALSYDSQGVYMYSGGQEGTVVIWHLQSGEKTFLPRQSGTIIGLKSIIDYLLITLSTNQVLIIKKSDQLPEGHYQSLAVQSGELLDNTMFHPQSDNKLITSGVGGSVHFLSFPRPLLTHTLTAIPRNHSFTSTGSQQNIQSLSITTDGTAIALAIQRDSHLNQMSQLVFYQEQSYCTYNAHTRIDMPHDTQIDMVIYLQQQQLFLTTGADNQFRLWHQVSLSQPNKLTNPNNQQPQQVSSTEQTIWTCKFKANYKDLPIYQVLELNDHQLVLSVKNTIVVWDMNQYKAILSFNLNNSIKSQICLFKDNQLVVYDQNNIHVLDLDKQQIVKQVRLKGILKVVPQFNDNLNDLLIIQQNTNNTLFIQYDINQGCIKHSFALAQKIVNAKYLIKNEKKYLFCIDDKNNIQMIQDKKQTSVQEVNQQIQESIEVVKNEFTVIKKQKKDKSKTFENQYEIIHKKQIKKDNIKEIFNQNSHMITNVEYLFDEFLNNFNHLNLSEQEIQEKITIKQRNQIEEESEDDEIDIQQQLDIQNKKRLNEQQFNIKEKKVKTYQEQQSDEKQIKNLEQIFTNLFSIQDK